MANHRISIPTTYGGVSRQADTLRHPNQEEEATNVLLTVKDGASKRPGTEYLFSVSGLVASGNYRLHPISRDEDEKYLLIYGASGPHIYTLAGVECDLIVTDDAQTVLDANTPTADDLRLVSSADHTIVANTLLPVATESGGDFELSGTILNFDALTATRPPRNTYWKTKEDSAGHPKGYFKYDAGTSTFASMACREVSAYWAKPSTYELTAKNPGGFKVGMDKLVLSETGALWVLTAKTLYCSAAFVAGYVFAAGDHLRVTGPAGSEGWYEIAAKVSTSELTMTDAIDAANLYDVAADVAGEELTFTDGDWVQATKTLTKEDAFADYAKQTGDKIYISDGTGWTPGWYPVNTRVGDDAITITITSPPANASDVEATAIGYPLTVTAGTWCVAAKSVIKADIFADYELEANDQLYVTAGTGVTKAWYAISAKTDDHAIVLSADPAAAVANDLSLQGIGNVYVVTVDFTDLALDSMYDVAEQFQAALQDGGASDALISWSRTTKGKGRFTIYSQNHGVGASISPCVAPDSGYNYAAATGPFSGTSYTITQGSGDPDAEVYDILDSWTAVAGPDQGSAHITETTMPVKITRDSAPREETYGTLILSEEPYIYFKMDSASGTSVVDAMGIETGATLDSSANFTWAQSSLATLGNKCIKFNSSAADMYFSGLASFGTLGATSAGFTIEFWYRSHAAGSGQIYIPLIRTVDGPITQSLYVVLKNYISSGYYISAIYNRTVPGDPGTAVLFSAQRVSTPPSVDLFDTEWHHVVINSPDGVSLEVYYDTVAQSDTQVEDDGEDVVTPLDFNTADPYTVFNSTVAGYLDELAFYTEGLTETQIYNHYTNATTGYTPGDFTIDVIDWNDRTSGDEDTNPAPSLWDDGATISDICFHRNRFTLAGGENIVLSQAGDFFNFWIEDANNLADSDPIDAALSGDSVSITDQLVPFRKSIVIFTQAGTQFEMNAPEALTPDTAAITPSTSYHSMQGVSPVVLGNQLYFPASQAGTAKVYEYYYSDTDAANIAAEVTAHAEGYLAESVRTVVAAVNAGTVLVLPTDSNVIYVYRLHWSGQDKVQSAWAKYEFHSDDRIADIAVIDDYCYLLVEGENAGYIVTKMSIPQILADTGMPCSVHMDTQISVTGTNAAGFTTWDYTLTDDTLDTVVLGANFVATAGTVLTGLTAVNNHAVKIADATGAYAGQAAYVGRSFDMELELSRPYVRSSDESTVLDGTIKLHKLRVNHIGTGQYSLVISQPGRADRTTQWTPRDGSLIETEGEAQFVIMGNARDTTLTITDSSPLPVHIPMMEYLVTFNPRSQ